MVLTPLNAIERTPSPKQPLSTKDSTILATVGSTAPSLVWWELFWDYQRLRSNRCRRWCRPDDACSAIGEALITTAFGIIVAIIRVWLFNYFTATIGSITNDMAESSQELVDWYKRIRPE